MVRRPDPRIGAFIDDALAGCSSVLNVGAGAGSYEPTDRRVVAAELSAVMIRQRSQEAAPAVRASAMALPFADDAFEAALAVLTIHHWADLAEGLREMKRTARRRLVILTYDTSVGGFWLTDYFPEILEIDAATMPTLATLREHLGSFELVEVPVPHDCVDGFLGANWRRPEAYLRDEVRAGTSVFPRIHNVEVGVARLRADLESGAWKQRYGAVLERTEIDLGYRLVVA